jgi:hypothetical protein
LHERDQVKAHIGQQLQQANARLQEAGNALNQEKAVAKKAHDDFGPEAPARRGAHRPGAAGVADEASARWRRG